MTSVKTQLRQEIISSLTNQTIAAARIYDSRINPLDGSLLPAVIIYTPSETIKRLTMGNPPGVMRHIEVLIEAILQSHDSYQAQLDDFAANIEAILYSWSSSSLLLCDWQLQNIKTALGQSGEIPTVSAAMVFQAEIQTPMGNSETILS